MVNLINEGTVRPDLYLDIFKSKYSQIGKKRLRASNDLNLEALRKDDQSLESQLTESQNQRSSYQVVNFNVKLNKQQEDDLIKELLEQA